MASDGRPVCAEGGRGGGPTERSGMALIKSRRTGEGDGRTVAREVRNYVRTQRHKYAHGAHECPQMRHLHRERGGKVHLLLNWCQARSLQDQMRHLRQERGWEVHLQRTRPEQEKKDVQLMTSRMFPAFSSLSPR